MRIRVATLALSRLVPGHLVKPAFPKVRGLRDYRNTATGNITFTDADQGVLIAGPFDDHWYVLFPTMPCWVHGSVLEVIQRNFMSEADLNAARESHRAAISFLP